MLVGSLSSFYVFKHSMNILSNHNLQVFFPKEAKLSIDKFPCKIPKLIG